MTEGSPSGAQRGRPGSYLLVLGAAVLGLAALAAWTGSRADPQGEDRAAVTAILVDTSASVTRSRPGWRRWAVRQAADVLGRARDRDESVLVVGFDERVTLRFPCGSAEAALGELQAGPLSWFEATTAAGPAAGTPAAGTLAAEALDLGSELGGALEAAFAAADAEFRGSLVRVVILGDGVSTGAEPTRWLADPRVLGVELREPGPASMLDAAVLDVQVPERVAPRSRFAAEVTLALDGPPDAVVGRSLELHWEFRATSAHAQTAPTREKGVHQVELRASPRGAAAGEIHARIEVPTDAPGHGALRVFACIDGERARDPFPENDAAGVTVTIGDPLRVLVVGAREELEEGMEPFRGTAFDGIDFEVMGAPELAPALAASPAPDVVITLDRPVAGLPAEALATFVGGGGGWIHTGGFGVLGEEGPLGRLMALEPDAEPRDPRDVVLFVDGSGSMKGPLWTRVRRAVGTLVPTMAPGDALQLRFFTAVIGPTLMDFQAPGTDGPSGPGAWASGEARAEALAELLAVQVPGGGTDIVGCLQSLAKIRAKRSRDGREGLVVLLSDGLTDSVLGLCEATRSMLTEGGDDLVVIHVSDDSQGLSNLERFLLPGEEVVSAGDLQRLGDLLQEHVQGVTLVEGAELVGSLTPRGSPPWVAEVARSVGDSLGGDAITVSRALRARTAEGAIGLLDLDAGGLREGTFAAIAPRGKGTVAGLAVPFVAAADGRWAPELRRRSGFLGPLIRSMALRRRENSGDREPPGPTAKVRGRELVVSGLAPGLPAAFPMTIATLDEADAFGSLIPSRSLGTIQVSVPGWARDASTTRVGPWPAPLSHLPKGMALRLDGVLNGQMLQLFLAAPGPDEIRPWERDLTGKAGAIIARANRSGFAAGGDPPARGSGPRRPHPILAWAAVLGALLVFAGSLGLGPGRSGH